MLTRATKLKLIAFALVSVLAIGYTGFHYANLGHFFGSRGYYVVRLNLSNGGGIYPNADVTYRGASVGRVGAMRLTSRGIQVDLNISASAPAIPARLHAAVADLSAVGEQYVDLRPDGSGGPYLADGSVIPMRDTQLPLPVTSLLTSINTLATSLPLGSLRTLTSELATGFGGQGSNVQAIVDGNSSLVRDAYATLPQTAALIRDGRTVLRTQIAESTALNAFGANAALLARELRNSDSSIRQLLVDGSQAAGQVAQLLANTSTSLGILIANLLTTSDVTMTRGKALEELLSALPADIAIGSTVIDGNGARFGVALTFFDPLPCIAGYGGTAHRNGLDTSPGTLNTAARCSLPASSGVDVRGSAHAPSGGGVPPAAQPLLAKLLGVSP
jgi:phospholipid/cholesterol/gamma-HCH transport system substrate-binding protein